MTARRSPRSLRSEYQEFIDQRIEEYKDSLRREEILGIGDEAMQELSDADQLQLTEVVLRDQVDSIIRRRLRLPSFRRWREKHVALRAAQQQPGHWGLSPHDPVVVLAEALADDDAVLLVGINDGACALFLAARGASVLSCDPDIAAVYGLEHRAMSDQLGGRIECRVEQFERFEPEAGSFVACVVETGAMAHLAPVERAALVQRLQAATAPGAIHAVMPGTLERGGARLTSDALRSLYSGWSVEQVHTTSRKPRNAGFVARCPTSHNATDLPVS